MRICSLITLLTFGNVVVLCGSITLFDGIDDRRNVTKKHENCTVLPIGSAELCANFSYRALTKVPDNLPKNITCLNMVGNMITSLAGSTLGNYTSLRKLSLARNRIDELGDRDFVGLANLEMLDLSLSKIHYHAVHELAFKSLKSLTYLDLKQNIKEFNESETYPESLHYLHNLNTLMIDGLYEHSLPRLPCLSKLYFSGQYGRCRMPNLTSSIFVNNSQIQSLYLSNCSIVTIQTRMFEFLPDIQDLDLSWNTKLGFTNITLGLKCNIPLKRLKRLNINYVHDYYKLELCLMMTASDFEYFKDTQLEVYAVAGNQIVHIVANAVSEMIVKTLKYFIVEDNMLIYGKYVDEAYLNGAFKNLIYYDTSKMFKSHIHHDSVHNKTNRISNFRTEYFQAEDTGLNGIMFTRFHVKDFFTVLDDRLRKFHITPYDNKNLNISNNTNTIEYLDFSENMPVTVKVLLELFEHSPVIKFLNISNSFLGYQLLDNTSLFHRYESLRVLDLSKTGIINFLPKLFENQIYLEQLYLSFNKITNISFAFKPLKSLQYLDVSNNQIESISSSVRLWMNNLDNFSINLAYNTLKCTCDNLDFITWVKTCHVKFKNDQEVKCKFKNGSIDTLDKVDYKQLRVECIPPTYNVLILVVSLCILAFILMVTFGLLYRYKWNLRYLYYMTKFKLIGGYLPIDDREYVKDVFVSYANEDRGFVRQHVVKELEEDGDISLLVHDRDFRAGEYVADNILQAITSTRRTLVILTTAYIHSKWCMYELNMARMEAADTGRNVLCIILKENIPVKYLTIELIDVIKKKTYIEFPTEQHHLSGFWERLRATLKREL